MVVTRQTNELPPYELSREAAVAATQERLQVLIEKKKQIMGENNVPVEQHATSSQPPKKKTKVLYHLVSIAFLFKLSSLCLCVLQYVSYCSQLTAQVKK